MPATMTWMNTERSTFPFERKLKTTREEWNTDQCEQIYNGLNRVTAHRQDHPGDSGQGDSCGR